MFLLDSDPALFGLESIADRLGSSAVRLGGETAWGQAKQDHCNFFLYHFHTFLYTP